jgi:hypothetical protein
VLAVRVRQRAEAVAFHLVQLVGDDRRTLEFGAGAWGAARQDSVLGSAISVASGRIPRHMRAEHGADHDQTDESDQ